MNKKKKFTFSEELLEPMNSKLAQMVQQHYDDQTATELPTTRTTTTSSTTTTAPTTTTTTAPTTTTTTTSTTTVPSTTTTIGPIEHEEKVEKIETVKTFMRYHIPAEVKISHNMQSEDK
jgi:hypothetical protein